LDRFVVASVQQRLRLPLTLDEYRDQQRRFLRAAHAKHARLVVFPELAGIMLAPPLLGDFRAGLLKRADRGRRRNASLWQKVVGGLAGSAAGFLKANFQASLIGLLDVAAMDLWEHYKTIFGELAREFGVTLVAPSAYLPDPLDGVIRNLAAVFGPGGELLGVQAKVMLNQTDQALCRPGNTWDVIHSDVGALGVILGSDVLYPEVGRVLAFQGAEVLVAQGACVTQTLYNKLRLGTLARMQDNQLFAASAYVVGVNPLRPQPDGALLGKSAIFAPQELTPRFNGVLVEMGNQSSEGVLTAEWDFRALKELWESSETPVRRNLPLLQASKMLAALYQHVQTLPRLADGEPDNAAGQLTPPARSLTLALPLITLDDLPIIASVTSRWPLQSVAAGADPAEEAVSEWNGADGSPAGPILTGAAEGATAYEEETDEMDALAGSTGDKT